MAAGIDYGNNHRAVRFLIVVNGKIAFGNQGSVIVAKFHGKASRV
jgi:hypothetical protein